MEPKISIVTLGVTDLERSYRIYHDGLEFPATNKPESAIIFFQSGGTCLALFPADKLAEDVSPEFPKERARFAGITLADNTRTRDEVDSVLQQAEQAGGKV